MLELIFYDLEGNWCEVMASVCLCMLTSVMTRNIGMEPLEPILMLTQGA
jgi:hypothetical protein